MNYEQLTEDLFTEYEEKFERFYDKTIKDLELNETMDAYKDSITSHMLEYSDELRFNFGMVMDLYYMSFTQCDANSVTELENLIDRTTYLSVRDVVRQVYNNID